MERNDHDQPDGQKKQGYLIGGPYLSKAMAPLLQSQETKEFVRNNFEPGMVRIQEEGGEGTPASIEFQKYLLGILPTFLMYMNLKGIPINPPESTPPDKNMAIKDLGELTAEQLAQLKYPNTQPQEHITELLRPERIRSKESQNVIRQAASYTDPSRMMIGWRIWTKLVEKAMKIPGTNSGIHPIRSLRGYNGMILGIPRRNQDSYINLLRSPRATPEEIVNLMLYEIENGLADEKDLKEIDILACDNPQFAAGLRKSGNLIALIGHIPVTEALLNGSLKLDEEDVVNILAYKFSIGKLDDKTMASIKRRMENGNFEYIQTFINSHEGITALIEGTEGKDHGSEESLIEETRARARTDLRDTLDQSMSGFFAKLDRDEAAAEKAREEGDPLPTVIKASEFNLRDWYGHDDVVIIQEPTKEDDDPLPTNNSGQIIN